MASSTLVSKRAVANIYNSAVAAPAIGAAWEIGLLDEIRSQKRVDPSNFAVKHDLDTKSMQGLVAALVIAKVTSREGNYIAAGQNFDEAYRTKSMFHWLTLGSGGLFARMQHGVRRGVQREEHHPDAFYRRDPEGIAYSCTDINSQYYDPVYWKAMAGLDFKFKTIVDLGSGSGERLMQTLQRYPGTTGIGIDIAGPAIKFAEKTASQRGFGDRLTFAEGDVRAMIFRNKFAEADLMTCFMMGHDFWPRENCIATLKRLREAFPMVRRFLLGDAIRILTGDPRPQQAVSEDDVPIWSLGFEFGHAMMDVYIPTVEEWEGVFAAGGWRCVKKHLIESPAIGVVFELEHVRGPKI